MTDFGLARKMGESARHYNQRSVSGTYLYMSPEQYQGKRIDRRADIYGIGMTLYELLAGRHPYSGGGDIGHMVLNEMPEPIAGVPDRLNSVILKCLSKEKVQRVGSASELRSGLEARDKTLELEMPKVETIAPTDPRQGLINMVRIPAGTFEMGSPEDEEGRFDNEGPLHKVKILRPFFIGATEVIVALFKQFIHETSYATDAEREGWAWIWEGKEWTKKERASWRAPGFIQEEDHPVSCVSWNDAVRFCNWLSKKEGRQPSYKIERESVAWDRNVDGYRLPTEAEWEYSSRAGTKSLFFTGDTESDLMHAGWYGGNSGKKTHPVGKKAVNAWGLYDMHGNVWEWCWNWYGDCPTGMVTDPGGPEHGSDRVVRGGSWSSEVRYCRSANRINNKPYNRNSNVGFRPVRSGR